LIPWKERTLEERRLLNPAFSAQLIWRAARGHAVSGQPPLSFEVAFLVLPIVLHGEIREALPRNTRTSLAVWLDLQPLAKSSIAAGAQRLVPFTKEALHFGGKHGFLRLEGAHVIPSEQWSQREKQVANRATYEVKDCVKRAEFLGKWFAQTGSAATVLALLSLRP
jgi:hypothetical protein